MTDSSDNHSQTSFLVVDKAWRDERQPRHVIGSVRIGGHPLRVILDFDRRDEGFIGFVELPSLLGLHPLSQRLVVEVLAKVDAGDSVEFPVDLSAQARDASPPSPFQPMSPERRRNLEVAATGVRLDVLSVERAAGDPTHVTARVRMDGVEQSIHVQIFAGPGRVPVMRWIQGADPNTLSAAQHYAIQRALLRSLSNGDSSTNTSSPS